VGPIQVLTIPNAYLNNVENRLAFAKNTALGDNLWAVQNVDLAPVAKANGPYSGQEGAADTLTAVGSFDFEGDPLQYRWDFNNDDAWDTGYSSQPQSSHTWGDNWQNALRVEAYDGLLGSTASSSVSISNANPQFVQCTFAFHPGFIDVQCVVSDPGSDDLTVSWNWGDGSPLIVHVHYNNGFGPDPPQSPDGTFPFVVTDSASHVYPPGFITVITITVQDDDGGSATYQIPYPPPN